MNRRKKLLVILSIFVISFISPLCLADPDKKSNVETLRNTGEVFADIAAKASPAVVFVSIEQEYTQRISDFYFGDPFEQFQNDEFFKRFFGPQFRQRQQQQQQQPRERKQIRRGQGSGFIVTPDGYILTNNHVVKDANKITVKLSDNRELPAKVVGTDPETDVAVIKINAKDLPTVELGDSDKLKVGEWVLAIGNPFGLSHTVTAGIVSAKGRSRIGLAEYEDFIQTDAAINFGNSGGPLINIDGKVIGMNTAIVSQTGAYSGIGFAIPINIAKNVYKQIVTGGKVTRGYIGIYCQDVSPEMADLLGAKGQKGIVVNEIAKGSPAEKAEMHKGDIIVKRDGKEIKDWDSFRNEIAEIGPGTKVTLTVIRDGKEQDITVELGSRKSESAAAKSEEKTVEKLGMTVQNLTTELAQQFGYKDEKTGVIVTQVEPGSPAENADIVAGTLVMEVNRQKVKDADDFWEQIKKSGNSILLYVRQGEFSRYIVIQLGD
jgi:serine protease Do